MLPNSIMAIVHCRDTDRKRLPFRPREPRFPKHDCTIKEYVRANGIGVQGVSFQDMVETLHLRISFHPGHLLPPRPSQSLTVHPSSGAPASARQRPPTG